MNITILGHFGNNKTLLNGQTIKTKNLYDGLKRFTNHTIFTIDTYGWYKHPLKLIRKIKKDSKNKNSIIMLSAQNGIKVFPILLLKYKNKYGNKIYYDVVGGWLPKMLTENPKILSRLHAFDGIWVETETMKKSLVSLGLKNVEVIPNFKSINPLSENELLFPEINPIKLCTFSRVMQEKGIETAINIVSQINNEAGKVIFSLDIYGQIENGYEDRFEEITRNLPSYIHYKGSVDSSKSVDVLKDYYALLFPTHFFTEGIPGTVIDAYCAGVPVISSKWESFGDIIIEGETGLGYEFDDDNKLKEVLLDIIKSPDKLINMRKNCIIAAQRYDVPIIIKKIEHNMGI